VKRPDRADDEAAGPDRGRTRVIAGRRRYPLHRHRIFIEAAVVAIFATFAANPIAGLPTSAHVFTAFAATHPATLSATARS
jgi:hypothetical protein